MPKSAILQHLDIYMQVWCAEAPFLLDQHVSRIKGEETKKRNKRRPSHQAKSEEKDPCCCVVLQRILSLFIGNATRTKSEGLEEERLGQQTIKAEKKALEAALKCKKAEKDGICPCSKEGKQGSFVQMLKDDVDMFMHHRREPGGSIKAMQHPSFKSIHPYLPTIQTRPALGKAGEI